MTNGRVSKTATPKHRKNAIKEGAIESDLIDALSDCDDSLGGFGHYTMGEFD